MPSDPTFAPLYAGGPPQAEHVFLQNLPASLEFSTQAAFDESRSVSPWIWGSRTLEQYGAVGAPSALLSAEDARARLKNESVTFDIPDQGISEGTFQSMLARQYEKRAHADAIARGPSGFVAGTSQFGAGLVAQALDPINLAAAFVPIVGESKLAMMLEAAGASAFARAGVYARVGALEGAVGTAALEPAMHLMARELQEDYTMADSLLNIAFGSILGAGLHAGVGTIREYRRTGGEASASTPVADIPPRGETPERVHALSVEARQDIGRVALAQAIDGRDIDVASTIDYHELRVAAERQERQPGFLSSAEDLLAVRQEERLMNKPGFLRDAIDRLNVLEVTQREAGVEARIQERVMGESSEYLAKVEAGRDAELARQIRTQDAPTNAKQLADLMEAQQVREELLTAPKLLKEQASARDLTVNELKEKVQRLQDRGVRDLAVFKKAGLDAERFRSILSKREPVLKALHETAVKGQREVGAIPPEITPIHEEAARITEEAPVEATTPRDLANKEVQEAMQLISEDMKSKSLFAVEDAAIKDAKDYGKALKAMADCRMGNR